MSIYSKRSLLRWFLKFNYYRHQEHITDEEVWVNELVQPNKYVSIPLSEGDLDLSELRTTLDSELYERFLRYAHRTLLHIISCVENDVPPVTMWWTKQ